MRQSSRLIVGASACWLLASIVSIGAQPFPSQTIRIVAGAAGNPGDIIRRIVANELGRAEGWRAIIENKPGGMQTIAAAEVLKQSADGYTILQKLTAASPSALPKSRATTTSGRLFSTRAPARRSTSPRRFATSTTTARAGVLWRHDSGQVYFWEMDGLAIKAEGGVAHAPVPNDWHVQGSVDFDGDGKSDILWRHDSGQVYFWEMDGLAIKAEGGAAHAGLAIKAEGGVAHAPVPNDWHIQGTGDFDGDGNSDILWRHDSGQVYIWEMNGLGIKAEGGVAHAPVPNDWHIQDIGDFNGDGKSDILWRHDSGQVYIWEMNGFGITAEGGVAHAPVPGDWHIFSPNNFV